MVHRRVISFVLAVALCLTAVVPAFAADAADAVDKQWSCVTSGRSVVSSTFVEPYGCFTYYFDSYLRTNGGFGSANEGIFSDISSTEFCLFGDYSPADLYLLPSGTMIYYSIKIRVQGLSGYSAITPTARFRYELYNYLGKPAGESTAMRPSLIEYEGNDLCYTFTGVINLAATSSASIYSSVLVFNFSMVGVEAYPLNGVSISCNVEEKDIYVKSVGTNAVDTVYLNSCLSSIKNNLATLTSSSVTQSEQLNAILTEIDAMGDDLSSVISYLEQICNNTEHLIAIKRELENIGLSSQTVDSLASAIAESISFEAADLSEVETYLSNIDSQLSHLSELIGSISTQLDVSNTTLGSILNEILNANKDIGFCVTYLQGLYNTLSMLCVPIEETRDYAKTQNELLRDILTEITDFDADTQSAMSDVLLNLASQGADLSSMKSFLSDIKQSGVQSNTLLQNLLSELQKVEASNTETNERLQAIYEVLDSFDVELDQTINQIISEDDSKGLGNLISKIINHLLSVIDFVGDLFGNIFTSIPSTISAFNNCNNFWGNSNTYVYTPHQLIGYTGQGNANYENSNESVQALFTEAEKYLGFPYVWGGSTPESSFDCSGFVCYSLNHSGVYSIERTSAQGLFDACSQIDSWNAKPGDLVFFSGTYDCDSLISHVGIYAGDGKMLHCGDPIQYESISTAYWGAHYYSYGRLPYNDEKPGFTGVYDHVLLVDTVPESESGIWEFSPVSQLDELELYFGYIDEDAGWFTFDLLETSNAAMIDYNVQAHYSELSEKIEFSADVFNEPTYFICVAWTVSGEYILSDVTFLLQSSGNLRPDFYRQNYDEYVSDYQGYWKEWFESQ